MYCLWPVGFGLRVTQGAGEGEEFSFDAGEARLGRTADNDVVIRDGSASRSHARVYEEGGRFFVEDLKSANGTQVNGEAIGEPTEVHNGATITIGDVVLEFSCPEEDPNATMLKPPTSTIDESDEPEDPNATLLKPPSRPSAAIQKAAKKPPVARRPPPREEPEEEPEAEPEDDPEEPAEKVGNDTKDFAVPPPKSLSRRPAVSGPPARARPADEGEAAPVLSAAERARQRRELSKSAGGKFQLLWQDLSKPARIVLSLVGGVFALGFMGLLVYAVMPKRVQKHAEPVELRPGGDPLPDVFGYGDGVDFERPDMKSFTFTYESPTAIVGVLHYQAKEISKDEVSIELNGAQLGTVAPDMLDSERDLEQVLPSSALKVGEENEVVFDNVSNPPGEETWRIWNVWVEVIPIPKMSADEAALRAKEDIDRAAKYYELREVGASNLFNAWEKYRDAWLLLEATPDHPQQLTDTARARMKELRPELDRKCAQMLVEYKKAMNAKIPDIAKARSVLEDIPTYFPNNKHQCFNVGRALIRDLEDLAEQPPP